MCLQIFRRSKTTKFFEELKFRLTFMTADKVSYLIFSFSIKVIHYFLGCQSDIGFILDSSGSLAREYGKEKKFLVELAKAVGSGARAGVVTFSHKAVLSIPMGSQPDHASFASAVKAIPLMGYTTKIDLALELAQRSLFQGRGALFLAFCSRRFIHYFIHSLID